MNAVGKAGGTAVLKSAAAVGTKAGAKFLGNVMGPAMIATDIAKNPWHVAKSRADKTGVIVGDLLARTDAESYVLIGHSLGARAMVVAAQTLGTKPGGPRIQSVHLLGAAIGAKSNWESLTAAVDDVVYGYHSANDAVLKYVYRTAQAGETAAGLAGFSPASNKLQNIDVTDTVSSHFAYQESIQLL
jgi:pimeloyl-ACP methyl ester carboxylesterase